MRTQRLLTSMREWFNLASPVEQSLKDAHATDDCAPLEKELMATLNSDTGWFFRHGHRQFDRMKRLSWQVVCLPTVKFERSTHKFISTDPRVTRLDL